MPRQTTPRSKSEKGAASPTIRETILDRTIYLMGKQGTTDVSIRAIAKEAGVNVAAVNYYFTSKEQMFAQMGERFLLGFGEVMKLLSQEGLAPEARLRLWVTEVMRYLRDYPGVLALMERQMAAEPINPFGEALRSAVQTAVRQLKAALRDLVGGRDEQRIGFKLTLLISALAGPFPRHLDKAPERRAAKPPARRNRFLDLLIEHLRQ